MTKLGACRRPQLATDAWARGVGDEAGNAPRERGAQDLYLAVFPFQRQARAFYGPHGVRGTIHLPLQAGSVEDDDMICRLRLEPPVADPGPADLQVAGQPARAQVGPAARAG